MANNTVMREYIISARTFEDNASLYQDLENIGGPPTIPNRVVECVNRRPVSRNTHYMITDQEAELLRQDPRILYVTLTAEQLGYVNSPGASSYSESANWNKSLTNSTTDRNWGLFRSGQGSQTPGWGWNDTPSNLGNISVSPAGQNVDIVIIDGHIDPNHPEFAVNSDGTGGSRVVQYNWLGLTAIVSNNRFANGTYQYGPYTAAQGATAQAEADNNHGTHVAGIAAGNTQGWARKANIYNINPYSSNPNFGSALTADNVIEYVRIWHLFKNTTNPTICNCSYGKSISIPISSITSANIQGTRYTAPPGGFTKDQLLLNYVYNDGTNAFIPVRYPPEDIEVQDAITNGVIFVGMANNQSTKILNDSNSADWDNSVTDSSGNTYYFLQGSTPGSTDQVICVGNVDNGSTEIKRFDSNCGPRVDVYAPGTYITSSLLTAGTALQAEGWPAGVRDPRNINYFMGKYGGTSMAAPQVTGMLACILESFPTKTQQDAINYVIGNAKTGQLTEGFFGGTYDTSNLLGSPNRYLYAPFVNTGAVLSTDATLSNLVISGSVLSPTFSSGTTSYSVTYPYATTLAVVSPFANESHATITVNGSAVASGSTSAPIGLAVGSNAITVVVTAQDGTTKTYNINAVRSQLVLSGDATLSNLTIDSGTLTPTFNSGVTSYTASVANSVSTINVTATANNSGATINVNRSNVGSGATTPISLAVGSNTITIIVTASDGTVKTYTITVTRASPTSNDATLFGLSISQGSLSPSFNKNTTAYTASVGNTVLSLTVTPVVNESHATVTVNGSSVTSGRPSSTIALNVGTTNITVVVTAQDGVTTKTYTISVKKSTVAITVTAQNGSSQTYNISITKGSALVSNDAKLSGLVPSTGSLSPTFSSGTTSYTMSVGAGTASIAFTPTANESHAVIQVAGSTVSSGSQSGYISLNAGPNTITVLVTAQDGITTKTYTIVVTKAAAVLSNDATLSALTFSSGTLNTAFTGTNLTYTLSVGTGTTSITLTPTVNRYGATIVMNIGPTQTTLTSGVASGSITTPVGSTVITLTVTAQDGVTTKTYTVTVSRTSGAGYTSKLNLKYGTDPTQFVNVYVPNQNPLGTIMYIHGGGWHSGNPIFNAPSPTSERDQSIQLARAGYAVIDVEYRDLANGGGITSGTSGTLPGDVIDTRTVLSYCLAPQQYGSSIDPFWQQIYDYISGTATGGPGNGLMLIGTSAGGHLSFMTAGEVGTRIYNSTGSWPSLIKGAVSISGPMNIDYLPVNTHNGTNTPYNFLDAKYTVSIYTNAYIQSGNESDLKLASPFYRYGAPDGADIPPPGPWYPAINSSTCNFYFVQNEYDTLVPVSSVSPMVVAMSSHHPNHTFIERVLEGPPKGDWDGFSNVKFCGTLTSTSLLPSTGQTLGDTYEVIGSGPWVYNNGTYSGYAAGYVIPPSVNGFTLWFQHNYTIPEATRILEYANRTFGRITFAGGNLNKYVTLTTSTTGISYNTTISVSGGAGPYTYTLMTGAIPQGITLNGSTGVLSGIPTVPGLYSFKIMAIDSNGTMATQIYNLTIKSASPVVYNKSALITGYDGVFSGPRYPRDMLMHTQYAPGVSGTYDPFGSVFSNAKSTLFDYSATQVYIIDEIQWTNGGTIIKPTGDDLQALADYWRYHGISPGGCITPAAEWDAGIPTATVLADAIKLDWLAVDPYIFDQALPRFNNDITQTINGLIAWTQGWIDRLAPYNIPVYLIPQGFAVQSANLIGIGTYLNTQYQTFTSRQIVGRVVFPYSVVEGLERYSLMNVETGGYPVAYPLEKTNQKYPKISGGRPGSGQTYPRFKYR